MEKIEWELFNQRVRETADILEVIGEHTKLKKTGKIYFGLCPFHSEKTASFSVSPERGMYYCFGCGEGGNVYNFVMKKESLAFVEARDLLARRYDLPIPEFRGTSGGKILKVRGALIAAQEYFSQKLKDSDEAQEYLFKRGIEEKTIKKWGLGYAIPEWRALKDYLLSLGGVEQRFELNDLVGAKVISAKSGAPRRSQNPRDYYDFYGDKLNLHLDDKTLILDLETAGLNKHVDPIVLIGMAYSLNGQLVTHALFSRNPTEEKKILEDFKDISKKFKNLVTFNGKTFDKPYLLTRLRVNRINYDFKIHHVDEYPKFGKQARLEDYPRYGLKIFERNEIGKLRDGDLPGSKVPTIYENFIYGITDGDAYDIIRHNQYDLITLAIMHNKFKK